MTRESHSQHSSYHMAMVFFPWKNPYPLESMGQAAGNIEDESPVIYASGTSTVSGITGVQYNRQKGIGGVMTVEYTGFIAEEPKLTVGTWCLLATSHVAPITDVDAIMSRGLVRFIGQVYEINASYGADASGRLSRRVTMTIREWCHVLHCPLRYHPVAKESNYSKAFVSNSLTKGDKTDTQRSEIIQKIGTSMTNVFQQPALALAWVGGLQSDQSSLLSVIGIKPSDMTLFSNVTARLPTLPKRMLSMLFPKKKLGPETAWGEGFMKLLSGVQSWGSQLPTAANTDSYFGKGLTVNDKAERPVSPTALEYFTAGGSLFEIVSNQVSGGGGVELFADLWYERKASGGYEAKPVFVIRDIPFTLKAADKVLNGNSKAKYPWTYFDDLPVVPIPMYRIVRINLKQSIHETSNLIEMAPADGDWSKGAATAALMYFGTTVLAESQKRFGTQRKPRLSIRDIFINDKKDKSGESSVKPISNADVEHLAEDIKNKFNTKEPHFDWFAELSKKHIQWYGSDYLFPSCQLVIKDADFPLACGVNIHFDNYVGHCEGFSQRIAIDESGRISNQTTVSLSRLCVVTEKGLMPMSHTSVINFLKQPSPVDMKGVFADNLSEKATYDTINDIDMSATKELIKANKGKIDTVFSNIEASAKTEKDAVGKAPGAQGTGAANSSRSTKQQKRKGSK